jgi:lysozyme
VKTSPQGRKLIIQREGYRTVAYRDSVGIWTIGCGHTSMAGPPIVTPSMVITSQEVDDILSRDLAKFEFTVNTAVTVPLADHEFDACVSLAFNIGQGGFKNSSVVRDLNAGNRASAADAFLMWKNAGGRPILLGRREAERTQFLTPYTGSASEPITVPESPQPTVEAVPLPPIDPRPIPDPVPAPTPSPQPASSGFFSALAALLGAIFRRN